MYFLGFAIFVLEALLSIWVFQVGLALTCRWKLSSTMHCFRQSKIEWVLANCLCWWLQRVYWFFRGKGTEAQMRPDTASRAPAQFWRPLSKLWTRKGGYETCVNSVCIGCVVAWTLIYSWWCQQKFQGDLSIVAQTSDILPLCEVPFLSDDETEIPERRHRKKKRKDIPHPSLWPQMLAASPFGKVWCSTSPAPFLFLLFSFFVIINAHNFLFSSGWRFL